VQEGDFESFFDQFPPSLKLRRDKRGWFDRVAAFAKAMAAEERVERVEGSSSG